MCVAPLLVCLRRFAYSVLFIAVLAQAQSIDISKFYYRDYLDFGQNKGAFSGNSSTTITGKDGKPLPIPQTPNFSASSNYGSLTSVGRGFAVTANHVSSPESALGLLRWGLTDYNIAKEDGISNSYGWDSKFLRFDKYVVEGQVDMLNNSNSFETDISDFENKINKLKQDGNIYLYQAGSGIVILRNGSQTLTKFNAKNNGKTKGGGFGTLESITFGKCEICGNTTTSGIVFNYKPNSSFQNLITSGDSGSGIYAYDNTNQKWILLGVVSQTFVQLGLDEAKISFASKKNFESYQSKFEQKIDLGSSQKWTMNYQGLESDSFKPFKTNADTIFSGNGTIDIEVKADIDRTGGSGYAGGFVFEAGDSATSTNPTTYKFINENGKTHSFKGSGLDIGENVLVEWGLTTQKNDSLHKIGKGTLTITSGTSGTLKIGEGKVTLNTDTKAFDNIYITSGRGELALMQGKAEALGATKNGATSTTSYKLTQENTDKMGFYFGTGGGKFDLAGNSLVLNTIAANDSKAIITNSNGSVTLTIEGFGYESDNKTSTKKDTIIHATIGDTKSNIDLKYSGKNTTNSATTSSLRVSEANAAIQESSKAHLIFDGNINTSGKMEVTNGNIALQGHATTHATISNNSIIDKIKTAESGTSQKMPDYMDLSKPSHLEQPDWDNRTFKFGTGGITLTNSNLTLGRNASLDSNITLDSTSKVEFGGSVKHFIDNKDGKNVTGSGFSYQQLVESGNLSGKSLEGANETISYKGKITANGGTIESHIWDFNASLDLKGGAKLSADYLTLTDKDLVKLDGASATIQNLILKKVSDLSKIFQNSSGSEKLEVKKSFWFDNSTFDLQQLDSTSGLTKSDYDIVGFDSSNITGTDKALKANVELYQGSNLTLKSLTLKNTLYLQGDSKQNNNTKLTLSGDLRAESLENAKIQLDGKSEIIAPKIEFSNVKDGILALDKDATLTLNSGNGAVKATNSKLNVYLNGDKTFNLNASGASSVIFERFDADSTANFSGKISANNSSVVTTTLGTITASVDLSGSASLSAKNIVLENGYDSIKLSNTSTLTTNTITAKGLTNLTLNVADTANVDIKNFIFDGGTTNLNGNLIGENIELKNASIIKTGDLEFKKGAKITLDNTSKLEVTNLKVDKTNLWLNFAKSSTNAQSLQNITLSNSANLTINSWDFGNATKFTSTDNSRVNFQKATYDAQNGTAKPIGADSTISGELKLSNVGTQTNQNSPSTTTTTPNISTDTRFESLKFENKNLSFGADSKISVSFDSSVKKSDKNIKTDGTYYKFISTGDSGTITDNRTDSRIDFKFDSSLTEAEKFFVVGKFDDKNLLVKFLEYDPRSFNELNKHISSKYSEILKALTEHNPNDISIDTAAKTDNYGVLETKLKSIDSDLNEIAQGNTTRQTRNLLFSNDQTINTRISQVRLAQSGRNKHLRFAQNDAMYRIQTLMQSAVRSDAMPSYARERELDLSNSVWLNVGGGYFGGDSKMGFGATNIGYDRLFDADNGSVLVGAMLGFGGSKAHTGEFIDSAMFYNIGLYLHSLFCARGGEFGGHEIQSNISFSINDNRKTYNAKSAKNTAFGTLFALYYKYNFILAQNDTISHALKPVAVLALGYNRNGAFEINEYKQATYNSVNFSYGLGVEYNAVMSESFYSLALTLKDMAYSGSKSVFMSLSGAQNFIGYSLESAPRFSAEINLIGSHKLTDALYLQYGIAGMVDSGANYGAKGDIKIGYKF